MDAQPPADAGLIDSGSTDAGPVVTRYPPGPYGVAEGDTLEDLAFAGYAPATPMAVAGMEYDAEVKLSELRAFGYRYALVSGAAAWCEPCRDEAEQLPGHFTRWATKGGLVITILTENEGFTPADKARLDRWIVEFAPNHPSLHDPQGFVNRILQPASYPVNLVVELETMRLEVVSFGLDEDLAEVFEAILDR